MKRIPFLIFLLLPAFLWAQDIPPLNLPAVSPNSPAQYRELKLGDWTGGLNKRDFPTEMANNQAVELLNFVWEGKRLIPRDGFTTYTASEFAPNKKIYGLYPYDQQDGDHIVLAGTDDTLYADTNRSGSFVAVKGGLQANGKYYHFDIFKDNAIVAHEGDHPFYYCMGCTPPIRSLGRMDSVYGSYTDSAADCKALVYGGPNVDWGDDQWAGYIVQWDRYTPSPRYLYHFISSNSSDTLYAEGHNFHGSTQLFYYRILPYFITENPVLSDTVDSVVISPTDTCMQRIHFGNSLNASMLDTPYVAKIRGEEKFVIYVNNERVTVSDHFDTVQVGDSVFICKKSFYHGRILKAYKNRIFIAGDQLLVNTVYFSAENNLDDFPPDNFFTIKSEDGDHITGMATFYDDQLGYKERSRDCLVFFKQNSIWKLVWNASDDYFLVQVADGIGCVAPQSIVTVEGKFILFLHSTGVYAFDGRTVTLISNNINPTIKEMRENLVDVAAGYYDRHYYLNYPQNVLYEGFEDSTEWTLHGGDSYNIDSTNTRQGGQALKINSVSGAATSIRRAVSWDLSGAENFVFWAYGHDNLTRNDYIVLYLTSGDTTFTNRLVATISGSMMKKGWNRFVLGKDSFGVTGTESWSNTMTFFRVRVKGVTDSSASFTVDDFRINYSTRAKAIISFDDGDASVYDSAKAIMDQYGFRGTAFIITNQIGTAGKMTLAELTELKNAGWDISNHTYNHPDLTTIDLDSMSQEVNEAYDWLVDNGFESSAKFFSYPYGAYGDSTIDTVEVNHVLARATHRSDFQTFFNLDDDNIDMIMKCNSGDSTGADSINAVKGWIDRAIQRNGLLVLLYHQVVDSNKTYLQEVCKYLREKDSEIDVITFGDLYRGIDEWERQYKSLVYNIDLGSWGNTDLRAGIFAPQPSVEKGGQLLFSTPDYNSLIYEFASAEKDTAQSIFLALKSKPFTFGDIHRERIFKYFDVDYYLNADSVNVYFYTDFGTMLRYSSAFTDGGGYRHVRMPINTDRLGRNFSFKLTSNNKFKLGTVSLKFLEVGE